jgi:hypothetical protein
MKHGPRLAECTILGSLRSEGGLVEIGRGEGSSRREKERGVGGLFFVYLVGNGGVHFPGIGEGPEERDQNEDTEGWENKV